MKISIDIYGERFNKLNFETKVNDIIYIDRDGYDSLDCLSIENPCRVGIEYDLESYGEWYVKFIEKYYDEMIQAGVEEINLMINVFYSEQCNFEIFGREMMNRLGRFPIAYPVSVYQTSDAELEEIRSLHAKVK